MAFDMTRCPQTEDEARDWFYAGIGAQLGAPATNWEAILTNCGLPPGYGPGVVPNASMPYFAFTQQLSGAPKGRIFLPSNTPDENGYYTRCMQYLDDAAGTYAAASARGVPSQPDFATPRSAGGLVWAWYWVAGHAYSPVVGAEGVAPPSNGQGLNETQRYEVEAMIQSHLANCVQLGDHVALRASAGMVLSAEGGGPVVDHDPFVITARDQVGPWESFTVEEGTS